jgi:hypothetical protein
MPFKSIADILEMEMTSLIRSTRISCISYRAFDEKRSIHQSFPFDAHDKEENIASGEIARLETGV